MPVPLNPTSCGLPPPLSYTETSAVRLPFTSGSSVTLMKQLAPEATLFPQLLVSAKSPASAPVIAMPLISTAALPLFVRIPVLVPKAIESRLHDEKEPVKVKKVTTDPLDDFYDEVRYGIYSYLRDTDEALRHASGGALEESNRSRPD